MSGGNLPRKALSIPAKMEVKHAVADRIRKLSLGDFEAVRERHTSIHTNQDDFNRELGIYLATLSRRVKA